jgi:hypothetical protein
MKVCTEDASATEGIVVDRMAKDCEDRPRI